MLYEDKKFIGNKLRQARINYKFSQSELAEKINLSEKHISNIERGQNFPSLDTFFKMCEVLNLTLEDFGLKIQTGQNKIRENVLNKILTASNSDLQTYGNMIEIIEQAISNSKKIKSK